MSENDANEMQLFIIIPQKHGLSLLGTSGQGVS